MITTQWGYRERVGIIYHFDYNSADLSRASWHHFPLWLQLSGVVASELASFATLVTTQWGYRERVDI
ncbi:hypothetical protein [Alkalibacterium sp. MB6]|uniref:hypothetical protein n=1 Tax=Alkalibacterium sp. MB6 TaxID=2081965 RepID=UPI00137A9C7D|nr:hypothetical protein [Alkalibacterium sp. MB6]